MKRHCNIIFNLIKIYRHKKKQIRTIRPAVAILLVSIGKHNIQRKRVSIIPNIPAKFGLGILLCACLTTLSAEETSTIDISGNIVDSDGKPVVDAYSTVIKSPSDTEKINRNFNITYFGSEDSNPNQTNPFWYKGFIELNENRRRDEFDRYLDSNGELHLELGYSPNEHFELYSYLWQDTDSELDADEAVAVWYALPDNKLIFVLGRQYLPFGSFSSSVLSDPITETLGEIRKDNVLKIYSSFGKIWSNIHVFEGDSLKTGGTDAHKLGYGIGLGISSDNAYIGADFISNIAESSEFYPNDVTEALPGIALHGSITWDWLTLTSEYVTTASYLRPGDLQGGVTAATRPSATHVELYCKLPKDKYVALAWGQSNDAAMTYTDKEMTAFSYGQPFNKRLSAVFGIGTRKNGGNIHSHSLDIQLKLKLP